MDSEKLRLEILEKLEGLGLQPETVKQLWTLLFKFSRNALFVLYLLLSGVNRRADIAATVGISTPAVSKIIHGTSFQKINKLLYKRILELGSCVCHDIGIFRGRGGARATGWYKQHQPLSAEELGINLARAIADFNMGENGQAGFTFELKDWDDRDNDCGSTN